MKLEHICKAYGEKTVLSEISFEIGPGVTCLMAPSGSGKTTLLRILLGLEQADSGTLTDMPRRWAVVFQEDRLLEQLDAMGNLRFALGESFEPTAAKKMLESLGLEPTEGGAVRTYSGGMKRRLALARALLKPADAIALDEPFTGLDEENRAKAIACIQKAAENRTVLLITHEPQDAAALDAAVIHI